MLGFLLGRPGASDAEKDSVRKRCASRVSGVKVCLQVNSPDACDTFQQDLDLCKARVVCPEAAAAFSRCTHLVVNHTGTVADTPDCTKALSAMRKCLKSKRV